MRPVKFRIGDLVRVKNGLINGFTYGGIKFNAERMFPGREGRVVIVDSFGYTIKGVDMPIPYDVKYSDEMLELAGADQMVDIYRSGNKVFARDRITGATGEAICNPSDVFNFGYGAKLALSRLVDKNLFNGRVVCTFAGFSAFDGTIQPFKFGYLYEIKDGVLVLDNGTMFNETNPIHSVEELNLTYAALGNFVEVKN